MSEILHTKVYTEKLRRNLIFTIMNLILWYKYIKFKIVEYLFFKLVWYFNPVAQTVVMTRASLVVVTCGRD